jgi:hypothetical protein
MSSVDLLLDAFGRMPEMVHGVLRGLTAEQLTYRVDPEANSIAWLVWHMSRIADDHVSEVAGRGQLWTAGGWAGRWRLPFEDDDTGYGHSSPQVAAVTGRSQLLRGYFDAVQEMTVDYIRGLSDSDLDRVVDDRWDPPVTLGVRLVSVVGHNFEQTAQAAFIRGLLDRKVS